MRTVLDFFEDMTEEIKWVLEDMAEEVESKLEDMAEEVESKLEDIAEDVKRTSESIDDGLNEFQEDVAEMKAIWDNTIEESIEILNPDLAEVYRKNKNMEDSINNVYDSLSMGIIRELFVEGIDSVDIGDHLFVDCIGFTHHGVYIGDDMIVHYSDGIVKKDNLRQFCKGYKIHKKTPTESPALYSREVIVERALSRIGECHYHLLYNNCENFVRWCRRGK